MVSNARRPERVALGVFAKAPLPGEVKTRLVPLLGSAGAARLHAALVRHTLARAAASGIRPIALHCAPDTSGDFFLRCAGEFPVTLRPQLGADLGERMHNAFEEAFAEGSALILVGCDCPALEARHLQEARARLGEANAVLVPAEDGGYVLIGLNLPVPGLFRGVDWGSAQVLAQTRARFTHAGVHCAELAPLWDVDRPEDYDRLRREGLLADLAC